MAGAEARVARQVGPQHGGGVLWPNGDPKRPQGVKTGPQDWGPEPYTQQRRGAVICGPRWSLLGAAPGTTGG
ncbi:hypothetical protein NDU88_005652 [Pleurodeles waltl]|uniref:Uncharacterized protein n=1 Tax=Pleurodeles waltl TaxID=8319 RepID=A0AAV7L1G6_PLEWA|nr:hypothetical protein NDU88_005652 [Pleurodeles waltl]